MAEAFHFEGGRGCQNAPDLLRATEVPSSAAQATFLHLAEWTSCSPGMNGKHPMPLTLPPQLGRQLWQREVEQHQASLETTLR